MVLLPWDKVGYLLGTALLTVYLTFSAGETEQGQKEHLEENSFNSEHPVPRALSPLECTQENVKATRVKEQRE